MTLRDHQPDILFQGDTLRRGLHRARGEVTFLSRNIAVELTAMAATADPARKGAGRTWMVASASDSTVMGAVRPESSPKAKLSRYWSTLR